MIAPPDAASRLVAAGAGLVSLAVLADSALEHYRGSFRNPAMLAPLVSSSATLVVTGRSAGGCAPGVPMLRGASHAGAVATGLTGLGFHTYNVFKRPGGAGFTNLFHAAPIGAPAALVLAGALGAAADAMAAPAQRIGPFPLRSGRAIGALAAVGILGTTGEAALFHFRGAYHNPAMWLPVALPPLAGLSLGWDVAQRSASGRSTALLALTAAIGLAGVGFHSYGIHRMMGGWRNWRQNLLAGPPLPAPPSFTGLAVAGLGALLLMRRAARG